MDRFTTRHRVAVTTVFAANGALFASLFSRLPEVQDRLGLDEGQLGLALLAAPIGLVAAVLLAGSLVARWGSRAVSAIGGAAFAAGLVLPALASSFAQLALSLLFFGAASGLLDVAMNTQGLTVEKHYPRRIFASLHAGFSLGALSGAAGAGLLAHAGVPLTAHLLGAGALIGLVLLLAVRVFVPDADPSAASRGGAKLQLPPRALAPIGAIAFCVLLAEGALNDWSAVYLTRVHGTDAGMAALGLAVFSITMGAARLAGDRLGAAFGSRRTVRAGMLIAFAGFAAAALAPSPATAIVAFAGIGLGLASVYPLTMRAAAEHPGIPPSVAIAGVTTLGYVGFLAGPPLVGLIAHASSLRASLVLIAVLALAAAWLARAIPSAEPARAATRARRARTFRAPRARSEAAR